MSNSNSTDLNNFSSVINFSAERILKEYNDFVNDEDSVNKNNHITGGVSSGISSSKLIKTTKGINIYIWYEISFVTLLKGRNNLINSWIENANRLKEENDFTNKINTSFKFSDEITKQNYEKNHFVSKEKINSNEIKNLGKFPKNISYKERGKFFIKNLKDFMNLHGFRGNYDMKNSLLNLVKEKSGRCTSGFLTFINVLKPNNQKIINYDGSKKFYIECNFSYEDPLEVEAYNKKINYIKDKTRKEIILPIQIIYEDYMKDVNYLTVIYEYIYDEKIIKSSFRWDINNNFFDNYKIGDVIDFPKEEIPFEVEIKIERICFEHCKDEIDAITKPIKLKKKYDLRFDIGNTSEIKNFLVESVHDFENYKKENLE